MITKICECGREFEKSQSLNAHYRWCTIHRGDKPVCPSANKGKTSPLKGKTLEDIVKNPEETREKLRKGSSGRVHSVDSKRIMSEKQTKRQEYVPPQRGVKFFIVDGIKVQGTWEKQVAERLVKDNVKFKRIQLNYDTHRRYTPDFFLYEMSIYLEVKGWMRTQDIDKYKKVLKDNDIDLRIIHGKDFEDFVNDKISILDLPMLDRFLEKNILA